MTSKKPSRKLLYGIAMGLALLLVLAGPPPVSQGVQGAEASLVDSLADVATARDKASLVQVAPVCPAGYNLVIVEAADFEGSFPPAGWTVANTTTGCSGVPEWTNTNPGDRSNQTGGTGAFAIADSDACGYSSVMNTEMRTRVMDLTGLINPQVVYRTDYYDEGGEVIMESGYELKRTLTPEVADLDFSIDGGATWTNLISWDDDHRGPLLVQQGFPADNESNVLLRWNYTNADWQWWWQVDDVLVTACEPQPTPAIELTKTVGTDPLTCATTQEISVPAGTEVVYCYQVENTGDVTLNYHDLEDSELGTILSEYPFPLTPGLSVAVTETAVIEVDTTNVATWTAVNSLAGYVVDDSIPYVFEDIYYTGTPFDLSDDDVSGPLELGFDFEFFEMTYDEVFASSNGFATFTGGEDSGCCTGQDIPDPESPNNLIAAWWADLDPSEPGEPSAGLYYETRGAAPNRRFILQFSDVQHYPSGNPVTFQYKLFEGSNVIQVHYLAAPSDGDTHTAGIENRDGSAGIQYYRGPGALPAPLAVQYTPADYEASATSSATVNALIPARIGGHVFEDVNMNGVYEPWLGEPGIGGVTITRSGGFSATSNFVNGWYGFYIPLSELPGTFTVTEVQPPGYVSTTPNSYTLELEEGARIMDLNFGEVPGTASIQMDKTVGTDPTVCATNDEIAVEAGTEVYYCYTVTNTGDVTLDLHDLEDSELGTVLDGFSFTLAPEDSVNTVAAGLTLGATIDATTVNTATWTAYLNPYNPYATASATDSATVTVVEPSIDLVKTVGTAGDGCADSSFIAVPTGSEVFYCLTLHNTGDVALTTHTIDDPILGISNRVVDTALGVGDSLALTSTDIPELGSVLIEAFTVNTATVTSEADPAVVAPPPIRASSSATAAVDVFDASMVVTKTVGTIPGQCASTTAISVDQGSDVSYCLTVHNTGVVSFTAIAIQDPALDISTTVTTLVGPDETVSLTSNDVPGLFFGPIYQSMTNTANVTAQGPSPIISGEDFFISESVTAQVIVEPVYRVTLAPAQATNPVGLTHTVVATVEDLLEEPGAGLPIEFTVSGVNSATDAQTTNGNGQATFAYDGISNNLTLTNTDTIQAQLLVPNTVFYGDAIKTWRPITLTVEGLGVGSPEQVVRTITATVTTVDDGEPVPGVQVLLQVTGGTEVTKTEDTNSDGQAVLSYNSPGPQPGVSAMLKPGASGQKGQHPQATDHVTVAVDLNRNLAVDASLREPFWQFELPTAITLVSFTAQRNSDGAVTVRWQTGVEIDTVGFHLHRAPAPAGPYVRINDQLIPAAGAGGGTTYTYLDAPPGPGPFYYQLEDVDYYGVSTFHGPVSVSAAAWNRALFLPTIRK